MTASESRVHRRGTALRLPGWHANSDSEWPGTYASLCARPRAVAAAQCQLANLKMSALAGITVTNHWHASVPQCSAPWYVQCHLNPASRRPPPARPTVPVPWRSESELRKLTVNPAGDLTAGVMAAHRGRTGTVTGMRPYGGLGLLNTHIPA